MQKKSTLAIFRSLITSNLSLFVIEISKAANKLAVKYNIERVYRNYREMLKQEDLDVVSICKPYEIDRNIYFLH
ncbi:hypothetical protein [Gracilibacillus sp. YIM 98692]|uniref:hypothetical protein n=1 Tax=Gracilibacillus sp. YIM 98692 TaxID=2663532 RepID=UPI0013D37261|nr:hypothetical protein [Gracilibacillus sp. YIM 98692]